MHAAAWSEVCDVAPYRPAVHEPLATLHAPCPELAVYVPTGHA